MWFILGMIVLIMLLAIIGTIVKVKTDNKNTILFTGAIIGAVIVYITGIRILGKEIDKQKARVNELTTKLYESYSLIDSFEQQIPIDVLEEDK